MNIIMKTGKEISPDALSEHIANIDAMQEYLSCRIYNKDDTRHLADIIARKQIEDTDLVMCFSLDFENASVLITDSILKMWHMTVQDLFCCWLTVSEPKNPTYEIMPMSSALSELCADSEEVFIGNTPLIVLTNKRRYLGAGEVMNPHVRQKLLKMFPDGVWILPSSMHEVLVKSILPDDDIDYLLQMVREINATEVAPEDRLSNNIYQMYTVDRLIQIGEMPL